MPPNFTALFQSSNSVYK